MEPSDIDTSKDEDTGSDSIEEQQSQSGSEQDMNSSLLEGKHREEIQERKHRLQEEAVRKGGRKIGSEKERNKTSLPPYKVMRDISSIYPYCYDTSEQDEESEQSSDSSDANSDNVSYYTGASSSNSSKAKKERWRQTGG